MFEMLLGSTRLARSISSSEDFFFFEGLKPPTLTMTWNAGVAFEQTPSIDGKTAVFSTGTSELTVRFNPSLDLLNNDWTLEWSDINTAIPASDYAGELSLSADAIVNGLTARYGNGGFGNRLQFGGRMATLETVWNTPFTKAGLVGVLKRYALVSTNKNIALYVDGQRQFFSVWGDAAYNVPTFMLADVNIDKIGKLVLGQNVPNGFGAVPAKRGPVRLSMFARYDNNYTPLPIG